MSTQPDPGSQNVESPCVQICTLDEQQVCVGCGRSLDEIARWSRLSATEKREVCELAAQRLQARQSGVSGPRDRG